MDCLRLNTVDGGVIARCFTIQTVSWFLKRIGLTGHGGTDGGWENSFAVVGLTAFGTVVKGWNDFKQFSLKVDMCRFAYATY